MDNEWLKIIESMSYGIYILTSAHEGEINGMVASWVSQVSFDPPLIMAAVHPNRYSHDLIERSGCFVLHTLLDTQKDLVKRFKRPDTHLKFESIDWSKGNR